MGPNEQMRPTQCGSGLYLTVADLLAPLPINDNIPVFLPVPFSGPVLVAVPTCLKMLSHVKKIMTKPCETNQRVYMLVMFY